MTINITRMKELDDILNIMEPDADITDEQLEQLAGDADLRTAAEDIAIARSILTPEPDKDEVNARLKTFKVAHPDSSRCAEPDEKRRTRLIWLSLTATAAVIAGMIWILQKPVHNEDPSFHIITDRSVTSVLGTEFYLSSCKESDESLVLVNGKVRFRKKTDETFVDVSPGQEAVLNQYGYIDVHPADTMQYTSWRDGFIYYDRASLDEILKQIGAIYNVTVHCYNRNLLSLHMHFVLRRDQNLNDAVEMLNSMKKVHATLRGSTLIIR